MVRGGEETFSTAQRVLDSSHKSVFCLTGFPGILQAGESAT